MTLQFRGKYRLSSAAISCVSFSVKGDYIACGGLDQKLQIFSLADGQLHYSIVTPSPIKSLIWLPAAEQVLVCACHSGILVNIIICPGDTLKLNYFRSKCHTIEFMAADASTVNLATGHGVDVRVWKGDKCCDWKGHGVLGVPKKSADNCNAEIILTGLHWHANSGAGDVRLITTYRHHGIQLWDIKKMAVVQSINMPSPMLGSSLSPNGLHISIAKRGGYDLYSLDSGIVLHTYEHDLTPDSDKYPAAFLPRGLVFCGATVDGTVTLWDVKQGGRLQSVQHLPGVTIHTLAVYAAENSGIVLLATASRDEVRVWHAKSGGINHHRKHCDSQRFAKSTAVTAWAVLICAIAALLAWVLHADG